MIHDEEEVTDNEVSLDGTEEDDETTVEEVRSPSPTSRVIIIIT